VPRLATCMEDVCQREGAGHEPQDGLQRNKGRGYRRVENLKAGHRVFIEVKGRQAEGREVILKKNEIAS